MTYAESIFKMLWIWQHQHGFFELIKKSPIMITCQPTAWWNRFFL